MRIAGDCDEKGKGPAALKRPREFTKKKRFLKNSGGVEGVS